GGVGVLHLAGPPGRGRRTADAEQWRHRAEVSRARATRLAGVHASLEAARARAAASPGDAAVHLELARQAADAGELPEAADHARLAAGLLPREAAPRLLLAEVERRRRRYDAAMDAYRSALAVNPSDPLAL